MKQVISQITIYPVKSFRGIHLSTAHVEFRGLKHDRRWMVVDEHGMFLTQRQYPLMAQIDVKLTTTTLTLSAPNFGSITFPCFPNAQADIRHVQVWQSKCHALDVGEEPARWLSTSLGLPCRLVYMPHSTRREINPDYTTGEGIVSFADGYPCLVISQSSLDDLNSRLDKPVSMERFRPTFVVEGAEPFAEDHWTTIQTDSVRMAGVKGCDRCVMVTIDPATGNVGPEPLATLATYRKWNGRVWFGRNLIPLTEGKISVGDEVRFTPTQDHP